MVLPELALIQSRPQTFNSGRYFRNKGQNSFRPNSSDTLYHCRGKSPQIGSLDCEEVVCGFDFQGGFLVFLGGGGEEDGIPDHRNARISAPLRVTDGASEL